MYSLFCFEDGLSSLDLSTVCSRLIISNSPFTSFAFSPLHRPFPFIWCLFRSISPCASTSRFLSSSHPSDLLRPWWICRARDRTSLLALHPCQDGMRDTVCTPQSRSTEEGLMPCWGISRTFVTASLATSISVLNFDRSAIYWTKELYTYMYIHYIYIYHVHVLYKAAIKTLRWILLTVQSQGYDKE